MVTERELIILMRRVLKSVQDRFWNRLFFKLRKQVNMYIYTTNSGWGEREAHINWSMVTC